MLIRSLPTSIDNHPKQETSLVWLLRDELESWQEPKNNTLWSQNLLTSSQLSTEVNMSETSTLNYVYKRRNVSKPTLVYKRRKIQLEGSKSGSVDGNFIPDPKSKPKKCSGLGLHITDSCSSSKQQVDDVGECSSTSVVTMKGSKSCVSFIKQHGGLVKRRVSTKATRLNNDVWGFKACKVCDQLGITLKMLICDVCEDPFHMSCCDPVVKKVPVGGWVCGSCSRKKLTKMETGSGKSSGKCLGLKACTMRDVADRFRSSVRIGKDFQVEVPAWSGPLTDEISDHLKPMEVSPLECATYQECASRKLSSLSSIGNWLQCREVVDDVDGSVCGKWRRAPLFEVQSDNWECFSSVLWDPTHADCAVPQELDTNEVLKQLKYIEMLRPRLSAKRWKSGVNKRVERKEQTTADPRNTQKS